MCVYARVHARVHRRAPNRFLSFRRQDLFGVPVVPTTLISGPQAAAIIGSLRFAYRVENMPVPDEIDDVIEQMRVAWAAMRALPRARRVGTRRE